MVFCTARVEVNFRTFFAGSIMYYSPELLIIYLESLIRCV